MKTSEFDKAYREIIKEGMITPTPALFVAPDGKIYPEREGRHIYSIIKHPGIFGLTKAEIEAVHKKYGEELYSEGKARNEIFLELMKKGWMRIRFIPNYQLLTIQLHKLDSRTKENLWDFLRQVSEKKVKLPDKNVNYFDVKVISTDGELLQSGTIRTVMSNLYESKYVKKTRNMIVEVSKV